VLAEVVLLVLSTVTALAAWPEDPTLSGLTEHEGIVVVDNDLLSNTYRDLVMEIGTGIATQPMPSATTGIYGFEIALSSSVLFTEGKLRDERITPWDRAVADENASPALAMPTLAVRKGLPASGEIGAQFGWVAGSGTGMGSIYGRLAVIENYKPLPDVTLRLGYSGYIGNDELDVSVFEAGVTVGSRFGIGTGGMNNGRFEPFASFDLLRVSARPTVDPELVGQVGAVTFQNNAQNASLPLAVPRVGAGFQITSGVIHFRVAGSWSWLTLPMANVGMGVTL
jgi:hypothetical protein